MAAHDFNELGGESDDSLLAGLGRLGLLHLILLSFLLPRAAPVPLKAACALPFAHYDFC